MQCSSGFSATGWGSPHCRPLDTPLLWRTLFQIFASTAVSWEDKSPMRIKSDHGREEVYGAPTLPVQPRTLPRYPPTNRDKKSRFVPLTFRAYFDFWSERAIIVLMAFTKCSPFSRINWLIHVMSHLKMLNDGQWLKWGGRGLSPPLLRFEIPPCNSMRPSDRIYKVLFYAQITPN